MLTRRALVIGVAMAAAGLAAYLLLPRLQRDDVLNPLGRRCEYCGMTVKEIRYAAILISDSSTLYYDDIGCMLIHQFSSGGMHSPSETSWKTVRGYVFDYETGERLDMDKAWYLFGSDVSTPMRHGILAFKSMERAVKASAEHGGTVTGWDGVRGLMMEKLMGGVKDDHPHESGGYSGYLDLELEALDGRRFTLGDFLKRGRPVLLVFFATWCPTCSRNISALAKAYHQHGGGVEVVLASFDPSETASEIEDFLGRVSAHQDWSVAKPNIQLLLSLRVVSQETVFLISVDGEIAYEKRFGILTEEEWSQILHTAL